MNNITQAKIDWKLVIIWVVLTFVLAKVFNLNP